MVPSERTACISVWICKDCLQPEDLGQFHGWKMYCRGSRRPYPDMPARPYSRVLFLPTDLVQVPERGHATIAGGLM